MEGQLDPKVSIIISVHNGGEFFKPSIQSLLSQTVNDFELLIMDDGSTDGSGNVALSFKDERIRLFRQEQTGLSKSMNRLIEYSRADLMARADADDVYMPDRIEKQIGIFDGHPDVGVVGTFYEKIDEQGRKSGIEFLPTSHSEMLRYLRLEPPFAHPVTMIRKSALMKVGGYNEDMQFAQDYDLWTRLAAVAKFANIPEILFQYRTQSSSASMLSRKKQISFHRNARRTYWQSLPVEKLDEHRWKEELYETIDIEFSAVEKHGKTKQQSKAEIAKRRIYEANLAYGAKRPDIGMRCLFEAAQLSRDIKYFTAYSSAKVLGFQKAWAIARSILFGKIKKAVRDNPLLEW